MYVKFCGMTNLEDVFASLDLGVDFVGFVFYKKSPRYINAQDVRKIIQKIPTNIKSVGVFVEESQEEIELIMNYCGLKYAQVYRDFSIQNAIRVYRIDDCLPDKVSDGLILLDSNTPSIGGSAKRFNWSILENFKYIERAFVAGGVSADNIFDIKRFEPYGVDLVSSIEAYPGKKDYVKMKNFIDSLRRLK